MDKEQLLESWKEIAAYLGHSIRTCQIWEHNKKLPIHRLENGPRAHVFAYKPELDRWLEDRLLARERSLWHRMTGFFKRLYH